MSAYTIRELENLSGIKAHTIRIWEKRYGLIAPQRTSTNIRTYCDTELKKLLNISVLNRNGIKISKIAQLSHDEMVAKINQFAQDVTNVEYQVESLTMAMIDLDEYRFERVLARAIIQFGFQEVVTHVLYPFFVRIGLLWQTGSVNPAQEHFVSNLVKQKFFVALDGLAGSERTDTPRFVFFLPEGELHELGLLYSCYLARKQGFRTIYLGQSLPLNDLVEMVKKKQIDYIFTSLTSSYNGQDTADYIRRLSNAFISHTIYVSGFQFNKFFEDSPDNVVVLSSPDQFMAELGRIGKLLS